MKTLVVNKKSILTVILAAALIITSTVLAYIISQQGDKTGGALIVIILGAACGLYAFVNPYFGFYSATLSGFLIFYFQRLLKLEEGFGLGVELLLYATLAGIVFQKFLKKEPLWKNASHIISVFYLIYLTYVLIEFFNPNGASMAGNLLYLRKAVQLLITYYIALNLFNSYKDIVNFFRFWLILAALCALYACYQEWFGLAGFESTWLFADETRRLIFSLDNGNYRKFSTMSDPTAFGILMAITSLFGVVLLLTTKAVGSKIKFCLSVLCLLIGMAYSGTRTATFIFTIGIVWYILLTINNKKTLLFAFFSTLIFVVLIFGPIYGNSTINRLRSTFKFSNEESLQVRDNNRKSIQPYIYSHPLGGGLLTTGVSGTQYNSGHYLAGFPTDSGLLRAALETGWIGLLLQCLSYFIILKTGIHIFFAAKNPVAKKYILASIVVLFANIVAQYSQVAIGQIPESFFFYSLVAVIVRISHFEKLKQQPQNLKQYLL